MILTLCVKTVHKRERVHYTLSPIKVLYIYAESAGEFCGKSLRLNVIRVNFLYFKQRSEICSGSLSPVFNLNSWMSCCTITNLWENIHLLKMKIDEMFTGRECVILYGCMHGFIHFAPGVYSRPRIHTSCKLVSERPRDKKNQNTHTRISTAAFALVVRFTSGGEHTLNTFA